MIEKLYTVEEVADLASVTGRTIRNYLKSGRLVGRKIGGQWRFPENEVNRLLTGADPEVPVSVVEEEEPLLYIPQEPAPFPVPPLSSFSAETPPSPLFSSEEVPASLPEEPLLEEVFEVEEESSLWTTSPYTAPATVPPPAPPVPQAAPQAPVSAPVYTPPAAPVLHAETPVYAPPAQPVYPAAPVAASEPQQPAYPQPVQPAPAYPAQQQPYPPAYPQAPAYSQPVVPDNVPPAYPQQAPYPQAAAPAPSSPNYFGMQPTPQPMQPVSAPLVSAEPPVRETPVEEPPREKPVYAEERTQVPREPVEDAPDLSDVGKRISRFIAEAHDCSQGPQLCTIVDQHQSLSAAKTTSARLNDIALQESESGQLCQSFVEFDDRYFIARYTLFGTSSFILRCIKLIG